MNFPSVVFNSSENKDRMLIERIRIAAFFHIRLSNRWSFRIRLWFSFVGSRVDKVPPIPSFLIAPSSYPSKFPAKGRRVEWASMAVGVLGQDVGGIGLERLLCDCPVSHHKQESALVKNGERGQRCKKHSVRIDV